MAAGSSAGGGGVPPGFRFHPTDEELLHFYLKKKVSFQKFDMEVIREVDLNKVEPWDLQERCKIGSTPQNEWYFFSHKDKKYPTGSRTNRATSAGFWKATGRDKCIRNSFTKIGMRKTLVFYRGRAPHGQKTDWIMHEYRLEDSDLHNDPPQPTEDGWVVCRVFKKRNLFKLGNNEVGSHHIHNGGGTMMMASMSDEHLNISSTSCSAAASPQSRSIFSQRNHHAAIMNNQYLADHHLTYPHLSVHPAYHQNQYSHQLEAQNLMSSAAHSHMIKPLMLNDYNTGTDYGHHHHPQQSVPAVMARTMQVKQFMSSSDDHCESTASPAAAAAAATGGGFQGCGEASGVECDHESTHELMPRGDHQNLNQWEDDRLVIGTSPPNQDPAAANPNQINQLSLRSEMDFWSYGK